MSIDYRKVPALLRSPVKTEDNIQIIRTREFVEGYVLKSKWETFGPNSPMLVSDVQTEQGEDTYIKVKVVKCD